MSISVKLSSLSYDTRLNLVKELQFKSLKDEWIHPYLVENDYVYLPYAYAREHGYAYRSGSSFSRIDVVFQGKLRDYQLEVYNETIALLNSQGSCILSLHVGWGKSMFTLLIAAMKLKKKILIIVSRLVLMTQWETLIHSFFPGASVLIVKKNTKLQSHPFYIINATNVCKMERSFFNDIGTVIVDEVHLLCAKTLYKSLFYLTPRYLFGLSATPYRPDGMDVLLDLYFGTKKIVKKLAKKHTVYPGIHIPSVLTWDGRLDWNSVLTTQGLHPERNQLIVDIISKLNHLSFLVLCKRIYQGQILLKLLQEAGEHVTDMLGTKKTFDEDARILIATTQKCGVGFSHEKLNALIIASDMEEYFIQYLGRVFRKPDTEPVIFDLIDSHSVLKKHFATRKKVYLSSGGVVMDALTVSSVLDLRL